MKTTDAWVEPILSIKFEIAPPLNDRQLRSLEDELLTMPGTERLSLNAEGGILTYRIPFAHMTGTLMEEWSDILTNRIQQRIDNTAGER